MNLKALTAAIDKWRDDLEQAMRDNRGTFTHIADLFSSLDDDMPGGDPSEQHLTDDQIERLYHAGETLDKAIESMVSVVNELTD